MAEHENSKSVNLIRSYLREHRKIERFNMRNESTDALRIGVGVIREILTDLDNITENDVISMASRIKKKKKANEEELNRLSNAFLQNVENITAFSKVTGALNVVVKELTGNNSKQLACECLCNFSLGNDICCEKLTLNAGSYLIMLLDSTNQRIAITSAWTISNILLSDNRKLTTTLISQGLISKLINITSSKAFNQDLVDEGLKCLYIILSKHRDCLRSEDKIIFSPIIAKNLKVDSLLSIKFTYQALSFCEFHLIKEDSKKILEKCITILCNSVRNSSEIETFDEKLSIAMSLRIIGNFNVSPTEFSFKEFIDLLALENETFSSIIIGLTKIDSIYSKEILWIAGNFYQVNLSYKDDIANTLLLLNE